MHFNNFNFSDSQLTSPNQTDLVCLVLTEFPEKTVLAKIKDQIQQNCGFVQKVIIPNHSEIQCYFQSMTDLIELDQGRKYGAGRAFIRDLSYAESNENFQSESEVKDGVFQNSKQTFYSDESNNIPSLRFIPSFNGENIQNTKIDEKLLHIQKMTRLTSLQDQVEELEHWREELNLFEQSFDNNVTVETDGIKKNVQIVYSHHTQPLTEILLYSGKKQSQIPNQKRQCQEEDSVNTQKNENKKQAIISLVEGAVLAGIMYGGVRLLKSFFR